MCELNKMEAMELIKGIIGSKVCAMYYNKKPANKKSRLN